MQIFDKDLGFKIHGLRFVSNRSTNYIRIRVKMYANFVLIYLRYHNRI